MENNIYPIRSFIRFQAKQHLLSDALANGDRLANTLRDNEPVPERVSAEKVPFMGPLDTAAIDNELLKDIAATLFNSERHPELYRPCQDIIEATAIEDAIALDIARSYRRIKQNQRRKDVQVLNRLL